MPSARGEEVPTVDTTSPPRASPSESSCLPPRHLGFLEPPCTAALFSPALTSSPLTASSPAKETIRKYFREKVLCAKRDKRIKGSERDKRVGYLVQAAQGFWKAASLHQNASEDISAMLPGTDTSFLYSMHIACHVTIREKSIDEKSTTGRGRLTTAIEKTARDLSLDVQEVRRHHRQGRRYMQLAQHENGGPGTLFLLGCHVSTIWRRHLQDGDVELLLDYRKEKMPHHYAKAMKLNVSASTLIVKYMLTARWSDEGFTSIQTESMWLTGHVDFAKLAREVREQEEHSGDLPPDCQALRHLLDAAEQPDITDFMTPYQDDQWMRADLPNTWLLDSFPGIPVPTQQDYPQEPPHRLVDAVASSHTRYGNQ